MAKRLDNSERRLQHCRSVPYLWRSLCISLFTAGHIVPLRQPNPPVYYNVPAANTSVPSVHSSGTSSGLQSPSSSDGCCMSDSSSDHSDQTQENTAPPPDHKMMFHPGHYPPVPLHIPCLVAHQQQF